MRVWSFGFRDSVERERKIRMVHLKCCFAQSPEPFRWRQMLGTIFVDFCGETVDVVCLPTGDNGGVKRQIVQAKDLL